MLFCFFAYIHYIYYPPQKGKTPDLSSYISHLPDPLLLKERLDFDSEEGVNKDLNTIADSMLNWEEKLSTHLSLTDTDISDIKAIHRDSPKLQR